MKLATILVAASALCYKAAAHGYLSSPPPRGIQKASYQVDDLKSPNHKGLCRGEPQGQITKVTPGQTLRLGFTITAPHIGPCRVTLLDTDLTNESQPFDQKQNCAAPGGPGYWNIKLPANVSGRKVLRWYWEGQHIGIPGEPYEQCIDLDFGGGGGGYQPPKRKTKKQQPSQGKPPVKTYMAPSTQPAAPADEPSQDEASSGDDGYGDEAPSPSDSAEYDGPAPTPSYGRAPSRPAPQPQPSADYGSAPSSGGGGGCQHGTYRCTGGPNYGVCNWGTWVKMQCGAGTVCTPSGSSIACGWA
jgi:hypothetical protein